MKAADFFGSIIYVHTEAALPFVRIPKNCHYATYSPNTLVDCDIENMPLQEMTASIEGFTITQRKPILSNALLKFTGLFTNRYASRTTLCYKSNIFNTTDKTIKFVFSEMKGANIKTAQ
jgi:hypothetical protein